MSDETARLSEETLEAGDCEESGRKYDKADGEGECCKLNGVSRSELVRKNEGWLGMHMNNIGTRG